jgi:hypothetical protein
MPTRKDFDATKCDDCLRITRIDIEGDIITLMSNPRS